MSIAEKLTIIAENEQKVYNAGYEKGKAEGGGDTEAAFEEGRQAENKAFWDLITQNNTRKPWAYLLMGWSCEYVRPPYKICPTSGTLAQMFSENPALKKVESEFFDFSGYTPTQATGTSAWYALFRTSTNLEEIEDLGMKAGGYYQTYFNCPNLHTIAVVRTQAETAWNGAFNGCTSLANLKIEGTIGQNGFDVHWSTKLSKASILSILRACNKENAGVTITLPKYPDISGGEDFGTYLVNGADPELTDAWTATVGNYTFAYL